MTRVCILTLLVSATAAVGDDWPQWRGPDRTGVSKETGLLKDWPKEGPKLLWKVAGLGDGYSTPSVVGDLVYLMGTDGKDEYMYCLDGTKDGAKVWSVKMGKETGGYPAPKSTPTVDGGFAYAVSSDGILACVDVKKGAIKWSKEFKKDFAGKSGGWAYTESPLIDGDNLVCTPGGDTATLVALKKDSGDLVWKAVLPKSELKEINEKKDKWDGRTAGYSSVVAAEIGGVKQYVQFVAGGVVAVDAKDGKFLWSYKNPANNTANCSTPIIKGDAVFAASAYGTGGGRANISKTTDGMKSEQAYFLKEFQNHHGGMVLVDNFVYGTSGELLCVSFDDGKVKWKDKSVGKGSILAADGMLYVRGEKGDVALAEANPKEYVEHGRFSQPERSKQQASAHPVVANGKLYLRDWDKLFCYDVKAPAK